MSWLDQVRQSRANQDFRGAIEILERQLRDRPKDAQVYYQIACTHDALGNECDAIPAYEKSIALGLQGEDLKAAYLGMGSTFRALGQYNKSAEVFEQAIQKFPEYRAYHVFAALTKFNLGEHAEAMELLLRQLAETSSDDSIKTYRRALLFYSDKLSQIFE